MLGGRGEEIKGDFSEEAVIKQALKNGQGFTRQTLGVQQGMLETQGPGKGGRPARFPQGVISGLVGPNLG